MFRQGDLAEIYIPESAYSDGVPEIEDLARRFNGSLEFVSRVKVFYREDGGVRGAYYEFDDVESPAGVKYAFLDEWVREFK